MTRHNWDGWDKLVTRYGGTCVVCRCYITRGEHVWWRAGSGLIAHRPTCPDQGALPLFETRLRGTAEMFV